MIWHMQAIFESKGNKMTSSAECRIRTSVVWETKSPADWMLTHKLTELSRIKQKLELDSLYLWWHCGNIASYHLSSTFVSRHRNCAKHSSNGRGWGGIVHPASNEQHWQREMILNREETRCLLLKWPGSNLGASRTKSQQIECSITNRLWYWGSNKNFNTKILAYYERAFSLIDAIAGIGSGDIHIRWFNPNFALAQGSDFKLKGDMLWCSNDSSLDVPGTNSQAY